MNTNTSLRTVEPLAAIGKHPTAALMGAVVSAAVLGGWAALVGGPVAGLVMLLVGAAIGAPGGAHLAEAAEPDRFF
jgi:hypothetical protein